MKLLNSVLAAALCLMVASSAMAQTTITSTQNGAWTTGSTWVGSTAPGTGSLSNNVAINNSVTLASDLSLSGSNSLTVTINSGGTLTVSSTNFNVTGNSSSKSLTIIIKSGGTLKFTGTGTATFKSFSYLTIQSGGSLTASGTTDFINDGYLTVQSGATAVSFSTLQIDYNGTGGATSTATINSGATVSATTVKIGNNGNAILTNAGTLNVSGSLDSSGVIKNTGTINVSVNFIQENSGNSSTSSGTMNVTDTLKALGLVQLNPGTTANSETTVGVLVVDANPWIIVGTNPGGSCSSAITHYADLIVKTNIVLTGSGDVTVNQNGRLVVFGNISKTGSGGGNLVTINCGAQTYVNGNINLGSGGGNTVTNNNTAGSPPTGSNGSPVIGLYVNGTTTAQNTTGTVGTKSQLQSNDLPFYTYIGTLPGSPLPVTLTSFVVSGISNTVIQLTWATASELDFDHFEIEKSTDATTFSKIGQVEGHGTTSEAHTYEFEDNSPVIGKNYYRLKSVDFDGYAEIFKVVMADFVNGKTASVYPNPLVDHALHVDLNFEGSTTSITIVDSMGNLMMHTTSNEIQTLMPVYLNPGLYVVTVANGSFKQVSRLLVK